VKVATLSYLAYSPLYLFSHLQQHFASQNFHKEEVKNEVTLWLHVQVAESFDNGIQKVESRLNKCLDKDSDYVEKLLKLCVATDFSLDFVNKY
jgi:hypothetical protein